MLGTTGYIITAVVSFIAGISLNLFRSRGDISRYSLDDILAEIGKRGYYLNIGTIRKK